jgi:acyl-CoA synthetase (AMP-forming)/AMP-acid ligase II
LGNPVATGEIFTAHGVLSGDLGFLDDDGFLTLYGRLKEMIRSGGENVFPVEVEAVVKQHLPGQDFIVYGVPDPYWGEVVEIAVVVSMDLPAPNLGELREQCRAQLAGYKLPRVLRMIESIPVTPNFKPNRAAIRSDIAAGTIPVFQRVDPIAR